MYHHILCSSLEDMRVRELEDFMLDYQKNIMLNGPAEIIRLMILQMEMW